MKIVKLEDGDFKGIKGFKEQEWNSMRREWVNVYKNLTPKQALARAQRAFKNSRRWSNGEPIWRYYRSDELLLLLNPKSPCFSLSLNAEAMGSPMTVADGEEFQFKMEK